MSSDEFSNKKETRLHDELQNDYFYYGDNDDESIIIVVLDYINNNNEKIINNKNITKKIKKVFIDNYIDKSFNEIKEKYFKNLKNLDCEFNTESAIVFNELKTQFEIDIGDKTFRRLKRKNSNIDDEKFFKQVQEEVHDTILNYSSVILCYDIDDDSVEFENYKKSEEFRYLKIIRNKNDEEAGEEINRLDEKLLKNKIISKENIKEIIKYYKRLVDLEFNDFELKVDWEELIYVLGDDDVQVQQKFDEFKPFLAKYVFLTNVKSFDNLYKKYDDANELYDLINYIVEFDIGGKIKINKGDKEKFFNMEWDVEFKNSFTEKEINEKGEMFVNEEIIKRGEIFTKDTDSEYLVRDRKVYWRCNFSNNKKEILKQLEEKK
ncbi:5239_t:CDS:2 [Scutellospora calospora]|uniref:5239_t:CDS:1 n=1 Tax=Scutellospora calospora TaxID=85575 RepID=A0ACA9JTU8_9GLOM|nr:5239_t:CDS:2 [Scutellospora calospora]